MRTTCYYRSWLFVNMTREIVHVHGGGSHREWMNVDVANQFDLTETVILPARSFPTRLCLTSESCQCWLSSVIHWSFYEPNGQWQQCCWYILTLAYATKWFSTHCSYRFFSDITAVWLIMNEIVWCYFDLIHAYLRWSESLLVVMNVKILPVMGM